MAWSLMKLAAVLVFLVVNSAAFAEQNPRDPRLEQALALFDEERTADAIALAQVALGDATSDTERWFARETLASIAHLDGRDAEALPMLRELVGAGEGLFGPDDPTLVYPLRMLAATEGNLGDDRAVTQTMLRTLRLTRALATDGSAHAREELLYSLSDLSRHYLDTGDYLASALLAAELTIQSQNGETPDQPQAQEGELLRALAHLRMGRPVEAASHALAAWRLGDAMTEDAADLSALLDAEFIDAAGGNVDAKLAEWIEASAPVEAERAAREIASTAAAEPMLAALTRGDPIAADLAARSAFDRVDADDPLAVVAYFALMSGTFRAGRNDLAATWAARLAEMPALYLAGLVEDPTVLFQDIATELLSEGRARDAANLAQATINLAALRGRPQDVAVQKSLAVYGAALRDMGDKSGAEKALVAAVDLGTVPGPEPARARATIQALGDLAALFLDAGRESDAVAVFEQALEMLKTGPVGREHGAWLFILQEYLPILVKEGQGERALALAVRNVDIAKAEAGGAADARLWAYALLARIYLDLGDPTAAIGAADQAMALADADSSLDASPARLIAARARFQTGDIAAANAILADATTGQPNATLLALTAIERANAGDFVNGRQLLALSIKALPVDSPVLPYLTAADGIMLLLSDDLPAAIEKFRIATQALTQPDRRAEPRSRDHLALHVDTALKLAETKSGVQAQNYATEAFQVAQRVNDISAGAALGKSAARLKSTSAGAEDKARDLDDAERALAAARDALLDRVAAGFDASIERKALDEARLSLGQASDALAVAFPDYRAFADPHPVDLVAATRLLRPDEVLVMFASSDMAGIAGAEPSVVIALTAEGYAWSPLPPRSEIAALTTDLRCAAALTDGRCRAGSSGTRGAFALTDEPDNRYGAPGFDYELAHRAYLLLLDPISEAFKGKTALTIVPDKALAAMPFHLMLTESAAPQTSPRDAPWLIRKMSVSVAPSVASFAALRDKAAPVHVADLPFLGIGDPLIGIQRNAPVSVNCERYAEPALLVAALALTDEPLLRDGLSARDGAVAALPALPETRCELEATSAFFGPAAQVLLHQDATETALKAMSQSGELERFRVLSFATHGLLAGELGANQAGLVLTPPDKGTPEDDGILTIEEIAALRINADFVLLSACNTAAGSRAGDESFSGLASAFFLAGARNLLVSHWPVYSDAAVRLTTGMYGFLAVNPKMSHAEALRQSMLAILDDPASDTMKLQPAYWGPFIIVGDGYSNQR